jgi:hypothetical protein
MMTHGMYILVKVLNMYEDYVLPIFRTFRLNTLKICNMITYIYEPVFKIVGHIILAEGWIKCYFDAIWHYSALISIATVASGRYSAVFFTVLGTKLRLFVHLNSNVYHNMSLISKTKRRKL